MSTSNQRKSRSDNESIKSETMETKDAAINQHQSSQPSDRDQYNQIKDDTKSNKEMVDDNEDIDPNFQKNSSIAQDLDEELKDKNDPHRRTLDEYNAVTSDNPRYTDDDDLENAEDLNDLDQPDSHYNEDDDSKDMDQSDDDDFDDDDDDDEDDDDDYDENEKL